MSPYLVAVVAFAHDWLYENGVLCYLVGRLQLRLLDLHGSGSREIVVDLRNLLLAALESSRTRSKHKLKLLYYSHDIVSCLYSQVIRGQTRCTNWLLVFRPLDGHIIIVHELDSISKLFVRNNDRFLYYGITTPDGHGSEQWRISGFDITELTWLDRRLDIPLVIGTEVGSTVCFEIFDGYFYGLSSQRSLEVEEVHWRSYYTLFRFPLAPDGFRNVEEPPDTQHYRRDHRADGPMDDRWTFLRMFKDEATGQLKVVESRNEWPRGHITARRTYYTTVVSFEEAAKDAAASDTPPAVKTRQGAALTRMPRDPRMVHPGDSSSTLGFTLSKCPVHTYHPASETFIDLVDASASFDPAHQQFRIRGGTRRPWTPSELAQRGPQPPAEDDGEREALLRQIDNLYRSETGIFWPPEQDPTAEDDALADLYAVLNPPGYAGNPRGSWDERSLVYATGGTAGGPQAIVFVSFDPFIYLAGTAAYPGNSETCLPRPAPQGTMRQANENGRSTTARYPTLQPDVAPSDPSLGGLNCASPCAWRTCEPAKYRDIARGYHFAR